jgi:hypothetical protein
MATHTRSAEPGFQSLPLGAVLEHATITCLSPNPPPTRVLDEPLEVSGPPFFAYGTTSQPFLARLRFEWTSGSLNPPIEVEHWVEVRRSTSWDKNVTIRPSMADTQLDTLHANTPALGDEQVLDVELDRNTVFRHVPPPKQGLDPWILDSESQPAPVKPAPTLPSVFPNSAVPTRRTLICSLFFCLFFYRIYHSPWLTCPGVSVNFTRFGMYINFHQVTEHLEQT